jgi:hypothetical protein
MATRKRALPICLCGCEGQTKGGRFLPGHDAKLKSTLVTASLAGSKRAASKLEKLGWTKFLEAARAKGAQAFVVVTGEGMETQGAEATGEGNQNR